MRLKCTVLGELRPTCMRLTQTSARSSAAPTDMKANFAVTRKLIHTFYGIMFANMISYEPRRFPSPTAP